ncbi:hypothetical protein [Chthoniobacter flavus]|uniref:hypothetical protein n=1 Tax=Chthoniobacter flavus TaxID=191863 RepID=UPI0005B2704D|nr:hypothetical protein [Chthoniobacter flavus]
MPSATTAVGVNLRWHADDQRNRSDRCDQESSWRFHCFVLVKDPTPVWRRGFFKKNWSRKPTLGCLRHLASKRIIPGLIVICP